MTSQDCPLPTAVVNLAWVDVTLDTDRRDSSFKTVSLLQLLQGDFQTVAFSNVKAKFQEIVFSKSLQVIHGRDGMALQLILSGL